MFSELTLFNEVGARTFLQSPATRNYVAWQVPYPCVTPAYKATWGRIKSIYR